jgi:hypothetical protein
MSPAPESRAWDESRPLRSGESILYSERIKVDRFPCPILETDPH